MERSVMKSDLNTLLGAVTIPKEEMSFSVDELNNSINEALLKPRLKAAKILGLPKEDIDKVQHDTIFFVHGIERGGLPSFIRCSLVVEKGTVIMTTEKALGVRGTFGV